MPIKLGVSTIVFLFFSLAYLAWAGEDGFPSRMTFNISLRWGYQESLK